MTAVLIRPAERRDVAAIVAMLADDPLGATRERDEDPMPASYLSAFDSINRDPNNSLIVAETAGAVVGVLQLTLTPYLTYQGGWRATIEGVRVGSSKRDSGIGRLMVEQAIDKAKKFGCHLVQLTTDKSRPDALRFYESLGFHASHEGMKLKL